MVLACAGQRLTNLAVCIKSGSLVVAESRRRMASKRSKKYVRSSAQKLRRSTQEKLLRLTGQKMDAADSWMMDATSDLDVLSQALHRQAVQLQHGMGRPTYHVLGRGSTPDDCEVIGRVRRHSK